MEITVYIDVLFAMNLLFNYLLLQMTGLLLKKHIKTARLLVSASVGALYAVLSFFMSDSCICRLPAKLFIGALMAICTLRPKTVWIGIRYICVFYTTVFVMGGMAFAFFYFSDNAASLGALMRNGVLYVNLPVYLLALVSLLCYVLLRIAYAVGTRCHLSGKRIVPIGIQYRGKTVHLRGYRDSGNLLRDEISGRSVIIAEWKSIAPLFGKKRNLQSVTKEEAGFIFIRYRTISETAALPAFLPDAVYSEQGKHLKEVTPVYIGLVDRSLDYEHTWDAILPHDFEGEEPHERNMDAPFSGVV